MRTNVHQLVCTSTDARYLRQNIYVRLWHQLICTQHCGHTHNSSWMDWQWEDFIPHTVPLNSFLGVQNPKIPREDLRYRGNIFRVKWKLLYHDVGKSILCAETKSFATFSNIALTISKVEYIKQLANHTICLCITWFKVWHHEINFWGIVVIELKIHSSPVFISRRYRGWKKTKEIQQDLHYLPIPSTVARRYLGWKSINIFKNRQPK